MRIFILILIGIALVGCKTVPVTQKFPKVPPSLMEKCPELKTLDPNTVELSKLLDVITDNYGSYHVCRKKVDEWINWYTLQKENYETIK
jgi:hypothetical protein